MLLTTFKFKHRLSESKLTNSNTMYNYLQQNIIVRNQNLVLPGIPIIAGNKINYNTLKYCGIDYFF